MYTQRRLKKIRSESEAYKRVNFVFSSDLMFLVNRCENAVHLVFILTTNYDFFFRVIQIRLNVVVYGQEKMSCGGGSGLYIERF